MGYDGEINVD